VLPFAGRIPAHDGFERNPVGHAGTRIRACIGTNGSNGPVLVVCPGRPTPATPARLERQAGPAHHCRRTDPSCRRIGSSLIVNRARASALQSSRCHISTFHGSCLGPR